MADAGKKSKDGKSGKTSRLPSMVGSIPLVGDLAKQAESQAQWMQDIVEQNARLVGQLPSTMKTFNDSLERFNQTVQRLDKVVSTIESATNQLVAPLEAVAPRIDRVMSAIDVPSFKDLPDLLETVRRETVPALRAATDTQKQVALLTSTIERVLTIVAELPGANIVRRFAGGVRPDAAPATPAGDSSGATPHDPSAP